MRIAQVAPLIESVPPKLYGGTERIVSYLTEELVRQGHEVTLFASGDSVTSGNLLACSDGAMRLNPTSRDPIPHYMVLLDKVRRLSNRFDIIHFHIDCLHFPLFRDLANRTVTTLHGRQDLADLQPFYRGFNDMPLVSISDHQRAPMPPVRWAGTIHHGLPETLYSPRPEPNGDYLAFLGRICPEKRPDLAIEIAKRSGMRLKIAAKVDPVDARYFKDDIEPLIHHPLVEFVGEIGEHDKEEFLGNALALVLPIDWPEPFGLVMIEAMACGTPVIAWRRGSVPEVVEHGVTGYIVRDVDESVAAVGNLVALDRATVRKRFERRFSARRMAGDYLTIYRLLTESELPVRAA